jgi:hypothetical protein
VSGERPSYDNAPVIDDQHLCELVAATGGLDDLAARVRSSAARLAQAQENLGADLGAVEVPAKIADGGTVVRDGPIPVSDDLSNAPPPPVCRRPMCRGQRDSLTQRADVGVAHHRQSGCHGPRAEVGSCTTPEVSVPLGIVDSSQR